MVAAACLIDVYETVLTCAFDAHREELPALADIPPDVWSAAFAGIGPAVSDGRLSMDQAFAEVITACGSEPHDDLVRALVRRDRELLIAGAHLFDDVIPFLALLRRRGIATAFVSNCAPNTRPLLAHLGLDDLVDTLVLSCEVGCDKPAPAIYRQALDRLGVPAGSTVFIDDQPAYCEGARALGIRPVRIGRRGPVEAAGDGVPVVRSLAEVEPHLG